MIHPNEEGVKKLGAAVANIIKAQQLSEKRYEHVEKQDIYMKMDEKLVQ